MQQNLSEDIEMEQRNICIDGLRLLAIFLIICIHKRFPGVVGGIFEPITRIAVPLFFIISGYYCLEISKNRDKIKYRIIKVLKLTIYSNILYLVWDSIRFSHKAFLNCFSLININHILLTNESPFEAHLWFLGALLYSLIFIYVCSYLKNYKIIYSLIPILLSLNLIFGKYSYLIFKHILHIHSSIEFLYPYLFIRNWLFLGIPFLLLGNYIYLNKNRLLDLFSRRLVITLIIIFSILSILEKYLLVYSSLNVLHDLYISTIFLAFACFLFALQNPQLGSNDFARLGEKYVLLMYIIHPIIIYYFNKFFSNGNIIYNNFGPIVIFFTTLTSAIILSSFSDYKNHFFSKKI